MENKAIIIFKIEDKGIEKDLEIPLDITANDLVTALNQAYDMNIDTSEIRNSYLKTENPIALLRGNQILSDAGVRNGTIVYF